MREVVYYFGLAIILVALWMVVRAGMLAWDLHSTGLLSFGLLKKGYWLNDPGNWGSGLTPNGRWVALAAGGLLVFLVGKHIQNLSARLD